MRAEGVTLATILQQEVSREIFPAEAGAPARAEYRCGIILGYQNPCSYNLTSRLNCPSTQGMYQAIMFRFYVNSTTCIYQLNRDY